MTRWVGDDALARLRASAALPAVIGERYRLVEPIGCGGMGEVHRAEDTQLRREVAIKILRLDDSTPPAQQRMLAEARVTARLEHPGILPVHDAGTLPDGRLYYVMKLVRGARLDAHVDATVGLTERLRIFERICETVAFAHARGVIHRDIKPQNVMLGAFGEVLLVDWGIAKQLPNGDPGGLENDPAAAPTSSADTSNEMSAGDTRTIGTAAGTMIGTPAYMPPEQVRGDGVVGVRSDVYALGGLLYFLLTERAPQEPAMIEQMRSGSPPVITPVQQLAPDTPRRLRSICRQALAADPAERYASATALQADVRRFLDGRAVAAHRENIVERAVRWLGKYRTPVALVLAYLLMRAVLLWVERRE